VRGIGASGIPDSEAEPDERQRGCVFGYTRQKGDFDATIIYVTVKLEVDFIPWPEP